MPARYAREVTCIRKGQAVTARNVGVTGSARETYKRGSTYQIVSGSDRETFGGTGARHATGTACTSHCQAVTARHSGVTGSAREICNRGNMYNV